jgi:hypothetical protein
MYPRVAAAGLKLNADQAVVDGEIVALDLQGRPSSRRFSIADLILSIRSSSTPSTCCTSMGRISRTSRC